MVSFKASLLLWLASIAAAQGDPKNVEPDTFYPREPDSSYSYPSPNATGIGGWDIAIVKARRFVSQLTTREKVGLCTGNGFPPNPDNPDRLCQGQTQQIPRLNFTGLCYIDSDTGIGNSHSYGTGFPPGITAASTWNRELIRARGFAIATEHKNKGAHAVLGPVLALGRTVGGGTNFEGFGNDPYLIGVAGHETVIGHQAAGVQAVPKQYLGYDGQQYNRTYYSSNIDDKTLHEVEVWPYAEAVRAGASCVMSSYPYVNNSQACQNAHLLNDVLKTHLAFQGYTQTDWFGLKAGVDAFMAGMDQDMPGVAAADGDWGFYGANLTLAVNNGSVPEWRLNDAATRVMTPYFLLGQDRDYPEINLVDDPRKAIVDSQRQRHRTLAREIAAAGTVLLKNADGKRGLPLKKPTTIALFGKAAGPNPYGPNQYGYGTGVLPSEWSTLNGYAGDSFTIGIGQGTLAEGSGSGSTFYPRLVDPLSAIQSRANQDLTLVDWSLSSNLTFAKTVAKRGTVCIPVVASTSGESLDRNITLMHEGDALVNAVADNCDNTIVIVQSVGPVDMEKWIDHPNVTAVVWANLGGQELGPALVDILYGEVNPSGRLVYTIAKNVSDYAQPKIVTEPQPYPQINYTEGVSIDYRGFEKAGIEPRFAFGHGLSYSTFTYTGLHVSKHGGLNNALRTPIEYVGNAPGGDMALYDVAIIAEVKIRNEGPYDGTEIAQLYLTMPTQAGNPTKILRGFVSIPVREGETQTRKIYLTRKDISYWDVTKQTWVTPNGIFTVHIGASSADIRVSSTFVI
ncbi:glycoside hydrolase family 3 protein [Penicillium nucicola]|uniref:glycoside hydrolase family 3 protein n=1 Tax=Penicillium nucicola TaxID=1850975 RepID=UPI0025459D59|nr:glycoside hydrolase family 3 protein [Penicillium nucicola]KAJ5770031.1 glycoside hydrolase family 3 protein [Penicillium nucicola]